MANIYIETMDFCGIKNSTRVHELARGVELRSNMLLRSKLHELQDIMEEIYDISEICLEDEQRYHAQHASE